MAEIIDDSQWRNQAEDPLFEALVKYSVAQRNAPGATDPLFEALARFHDESSSEMSSFSRGESLEEKKRRALELLRREGLVGFE